MLHTTNYLTMQCYIQHII